MFCMIVVISNVISTKMVKLPFFQDFSIPAGLITYPLTFFIGNLVTEIYGGKKTKKMVYHAFYMSILAYLIIKLALVLPSPSMENYNHFEEILGLNGFLLVASLTAYIVSQMLDIRLYSFIKRLTGDRYLWVRNNGSTLIVQLIDTVIINIIFLKIGARMEFSQVIPIMIFSYLYKSSFSLVFTPLFYFCVFLFKKKHPLFFPREPDLET